MCVCTHLRTWSLKLTKNKHFQEYNNKQILEGEKEEEEKKKDLHLHSCNKQPPLY